jgi:hypothetical protein
MTTVEESRNRLYAKPHYLVEIALGNSGPTLYLSDRTITVGSRIYEDYLRDLSGIGVELKRGTSGGLNADIALSFKNDRHQSYDYLIELGDVYPFEGAECTIKEVYLDDDGNPSAAETVFSGLLDEPADIDLLSFRCSVSSMEMKADRKW